MLGGTEGVLGVKVCCSPNTVLRYAARAGLLQQLGVTGTPLAGTVIIARLLLRGGANVSCLFCMSVLQQNQEKMRISTPITRNTFESITR